jgi:hypothetical protein
MFIIKFISIFIVLDVQFNVIGEDLEDGDDFHTQLASSYRFQVQTVDLVKLKSIRTCKNKKKHGRLFEQMGLPIQPENNSHKKKIFLSKNTKETRGLIDQVNSISGNLKPFKQN